MSLAPLVDLYRLSGRPELRDGGFAGEVSYDRAHELVTQIRDQKGTRFDDLRVDEAYIDDDDPLPNTGERISFSVRLPANSSSTFHPDLAGLLRNDPKISRGELPTDYYLVQEDFYSERDRSPEGVKALVSICALIGHLSQLAHYHDSRDDSLKLVFIQPDEEKASSPVVIETRIADTMLDHADALDTGLVEELCSSDATNDPHYTARIGVFGTAIAHFLASRPPTAHSFEYLVSHWEDFVSAYHRDLATYISGFAFHKAKREVSEAEFQIASQYSKVVGDITGKLLGIPVSLVAIIAMVKADTLLESMLLLVGVFLASLLLSGAVRNQGRQLDRIGHAKSVVLNSIEGRQDSYPEDLRVEVGKMKQGLDDSEKKLRNWLSLYIGLSWLPFALAVIVGILSYWTGIFEALVQGGQYLLSAAQHVAVSLRDQAH